MIGGNTFANRRCFQRDVEYRQKIHRRRLKNMKSISKSKNPFQKVKLDLDPPNKPAFLKENMSKKTHDRRRIQAIEHDNRILLKKMADIMMPRRSDRLQEFLPGMYVSVDGWMGVPVCVRACIARPHRSVAGLCACVPMSSWDSLIATILVHGSHPRLITGNAQRCPAHSRRRTCRRQLHLND